MKISAVQKSKEDIIVFDIGGTWFRSGIYTKAGKLIHVSKQKAKNYKNTSYSSINDLQNQFVHYVANEIKRFKELVPHNNYSQVAISMGAALNAHTGFIYNSGPLWGPNCKAFDLKKALKESIPDCEFSIINDVSAALLREVTDEKNKNFSKIMLITVSSGIACRIFDVEKNEIAVDRTYGLQGEIGHIPVQFTYMGKELVEVCDCGGKNHINAFSSGRGIVQILKTVMKNHDMKEDDEIFKQFINSLKKGDEVASNILDAVVKPLADILLITFTLDPKIEKIILTGGVVHSLNHYYLQSLLKQLDEKGMYQITINDPDYLKKRLSIGKDDDNSGLLGAALSI